MANERDIDVLGNAVAETDKEIFGAAVDRDDSVLDDSGDRSLEAMGDGLEGQLEEPEGDDAETPEAEAKAAVKDGEAEQPEGDDETGTEQNRDDKGKFAAKDTDAGKAQEQSTKDGTDGRVPPGRLREEAEKRRQLESTLEAERAAFKSERETAQREFATLNARLDLLTKQVGQGIPKPADTPKAEVPDIFTDPEGFLAAAQKPLLQQISTLQHERVVDRAEMSMRNARLEHKDTFDKAYQALGSLDKNDPNQFAIGRAIAQSGDPGQALVNWYRRSETLRRVGNDPDAFEKSIETRTRETLAKDPEFRKQLLEELKAEASGQSGKGPRTITRLPKSLNGASGGQSAQDGLHDGSERGIFEEMFAEQR